ncbi:hypothetical protein ABEP50_15955 [Priestia megaterium]
MDFEINLLSDISNNRTKRLNARIIVDSTNKQEIKNSLPNWIRQLRINSSANTRPMFADKPYEVINLNLYTHKRQANYGLPFCTVQWIAENTEIKPHKIEHNDVIEDILIKWESFHNTLDSMIQTNELPAEEFLLKTKTLLDKALDVALIIQKGKDQLLEKEISVESFRQIVKQYENELNRFENNFIGFPPSEEESLVSLQSASRNAISALHNVLVVVNDVSYEDKNVIYLVTMHMEECIRNFNESYSILKYLYQEERK